MNEDSPLFAIGPDPDAGQSGADAAVHLPVDNLPLDYEAFVMGYRASYLRFAQEILGTPEAADEVVHQVLLQIAIHWVQLLAGPDLVANAWGMLCHALRAMLCHALRAEVRRRESDPVLVYRLDRIRALLARMREALPAPDSEDGTAHDTGTALRIQLGKLTPRQFDVVILKAAGRSTYFIAWFLGTHPSTVDRNLKRALAQLEDGLRPLRLLKAAAVRRGERR